MMQANPFVMLPQAGVLGQSMILMPGGNMSMPGMAPFGGPQAFGMQQLR